MSVDPEKDCIWCNEGIVMLQDNLKRWIPVDAETWTLGETVFDSNVHRRHSCVKKSRGQYEKVIEEFKDVELD